MRTKIITFLLTLLPIVAFAQEELYSIKGCVVAKYSGIKFKATSKNCFACDLWIFLEVALYNKRLLLHIYCFACGITCGECYL